MNISKFLSDKNEQNIPSLRAFLFKNHIKTVIEKNEQTNKDFRIMFIGNRFKSDFNNPISFECNGIIFNYNRETNKFTTLLIPVQLFNSQKLIRSEINDHIINNDYELYKVYDGTIINIYYYNNSWRISTNKAYDATNLIFINNKTYSEVLNEILEQYKDFSFDKLDINHCYTICFKYIDFHPFIENHFNPVNKIILIQSINMTKFNNDGKIEINKNNDIGLPILEQYHLQPNDNINSIMDILNQEITRFKKQHQDVNYSPNYGLILRSKDFNKTKNYSNILLESNLMAKIRNFVYNHNLKKDLNFYDKLNNTNIEIHKGYYNISNITNLKIFLKGQDINLYLVLFPQFKPEFNKYNLFLKFLTRYIIQNHKTLQKNTVNISSIMKNKTQLTLTPVSTDININYMKANKLALLMLIEINNKKINLDVKEKYDIVYDFLQNLSFIDYYYSCLYK